MNVRLTESAEHDLAHAFEWYEKQREDLGYRFMARVDEAIDIISDNPSLYAPSVGEARRIFINQFPYAIWYRIGLEEVLVLGCLHHKRNQGIITSRAT